MTRPALAAALLLGALLAGCSGGAAPDVGPDDVAGLLRGVVVDPAIRPLPGAVVAIPARPEVAPATTDDAGAFTLADVAPGVLVIEVHRDGFLPAAVQATVIDGAETPLVQVVLTPLAATQPFAVLEAFRGQIACGVGSGPAFGLSAGCTTLAGGALYVACTGGGPVPPLGICVDAADPYFVSGATGPIAVMQTEVVWDATVTGMSELLLGGYVLDAAGTATGGAPGATGPSVLVRRIDAATVDELGLGATHSLALFVNPGNAPPANVVVQQAFDVYHTSTYFFEPDADWTFAADGPVPVPGSCAPCA